MNKFDKLFQEQMAKNMSIKDIAQEKDTDIEDIKKELDKGKEVEKEHTPSSAAAKKIAKDHLVEDPKYYTKLKKAGL